MDRTASLLGVAAAAVLSLAVSAANATIFIGLQQDANPIVPVASGAAFANFAGPFGNFEQVAASGFGEPGTVLPILLQSSSLAANSAGAANAGTLTIYVTSTGNTAPVGSVVVFTSGFATVNLRAPWSEALASYIDPADGVFALTTPLGSAVFNAVDSDTDVNVADTGAGPYSVTLVYRYTAPSRSSASSSAGIAAVIPEPASLALLGAALMGFGIVARRRGAAEPTRR